RWTCGRNARMPGKVLYVYVNVNLRPAREADAARRPRPPGRPEMLARLVRDHSGRRIDLDLDGLAVLHRLGFELVADLLDVGDLGVAFVRQLLLDVGLGHR